MDRDRRYFIFLLFVEKAKDSYTYWHFEEGSNIIKVFIWVPKIVQGLYQPLPPLLWPPEAYKVDFFEFSRLFLHFPHFYMVSEVSTKFHQNRFINAKVHENGRQFSNLRSFFPFFAILNFLKHLYLGF